MLNYPVLAAGRVGVSLCSACVLLCLVACVRRGKGSREESSRDCVSTTCVLTQSAPGRAGESSLMRNVCSSLADVFVGWEMGNLLSSNKNSKYV